MPDAAQNALSDPKNPENGDFVKKISASRRRRLALIPQAYRGAYKRAEKSKAAAIRSQCLECVGFARDEVRACTDLGCPLWPHRPYQP